MRTGRRSRRRRLRVLTGRRERVLRLRLLEDAVELRVGVVLAVRDARSGRRVRIRRRRRSGRGLRDVRLLVVRV